MGPKARALLQTVSPNDFSNAANPFGSAQEIELGMGLAGFIASVTWANLVGKYT